MKYPRLILACTSAVVFLGVFTTPVLADSPPTTAAPDNLICSDDTRPDFGQIVIILDEANATVTSNYPARSIPNGPYPPVAVSATSSGPMPANFSSDTIEFTQQKQTDAGTICSRYTMDRLTGVLLDYESDDAPWDDASPKQRILWHFTCHKAEMKFKSARSDLACDFWSELKFPKLSQRVDFNHAPKGACNPTI